MYAFGLNLARTPPTAYQTSDPDSQIFYANSNSYGSGYSDALMSQYSVGGPLISVSEPRTSTNVPNIDLTIFANSETPSPDTSQGYTPPEIYNYISATSPNYYAVQNDITTNDTIKFSFASSVANNAGVVLSSTDTITLGVLTSDAGGVPSWDTITFDGASAGTLGLWQEWTITGSLGTYAAAPIGNSQGTGSMLIGQTGTGVPVADNGVSWYQIGVGTGTIAKTFNLYTTTSGGQFENPGYNPGATLTQPGALAIDGLAIIQVPNFPTLAVQPSLVSTFTVNFAPSSAVTYNPSLLVPNTVNSAVAVPDAPVAGMLSDGTFTALAGQINQVSNTITATNSNLSFGWTGDNNDPNTVSWIGGYTNKIDAGDVARVTITPTSGPSITTTGTADIDGQWNTGTVDLANGAYTVTMAEYLPTDTAYATPLTSPSVPTDPHRDLLRCRHQDPHHHRRDAGGGTPCRRTHAGAPRRGATVRWIGHRRVDCTRHPQPHSIWPVRGAPRLRPGQPAASCVCRPITRST